MKTKQFAIGLLCGALMLFTMAAVFPFRLVIDENGRVQLGKTLVTGTNGITCPTNLVIRAFDGVGYWQIVATNATGRIGIMTNSGSN